MKKKSILITGITGNAGKNAAKYFLKKGYEVTGFSRNATKDPFFKENNIVVYDLDLLAFIKQEQKIPFTEANMVYHTAAYVLGKTREEKEIMRKINVDATLKLYSWAIDAGVKDFVFLSSVSIYDYPFKNKPIREDHPKKPRYFYAKTKLEAETKLLALYESVVKKEKVPKLSILRPCYIVGRDDRNFAPQFIGRLLREDLPMIGNGNNLMSFVHSKDLAKATLVVIDRDSQKPEDFNVVSFTKTFYEFFKPFADYFKVKFPSKKYPYWLAYIAGVIIQTYKKMVGKDPSLGISTYRVKTLSTDRIYDTEKIEKLGYKPEFNYHTVFEEILQDIKEHPNRYGLLFNKTQPI